jgi:hypothetical protein
MKNVLLVLVLMFVACSEDGAPDYEGDAGDGDTDSDSDSDTDSDADTDSDYDTDCNEGCTQPPSDFCDEDGYLVHYTGASSCVDDVCVYGFDLQICGYVCVEVEDGPDYCQENACDGVVCNDPPDSECLSDLQLLYYWDQPGGCDETGAQTGTPGACYYNSMETICENGCVPVSGADDYCS